MTHSLGINFKGVFMNSTQMCSWFMNVKLGLGVSPRALTSHVFRVPSRSSLGKEINHNPPASVLWLCSFSVVNFLCGPGQCAPSKNRVLPRSTPPWKPRSPTSMDRSAPLGACPSPPGLLAAVYSVPMDSSCTSTCSVYAPSRSRVVMQPSRHAAARTLSTSTQSAARPSRAARRTAATPPPRR